MKEYYLNLAGLRTVLQTPDAITVSDSLRPFLCAPQPETDCTITLQSCDRLPAFSENGTWHGLEYLDHCADTARIFHCSAPNGTAFAVTQLFQNGNIQIAVLPEYLPYFSGSEGIFNRIGMETLLLQHNGLLLHASLIQYKDNAIAFTGPSGIGKSTQADIWRNCLNADIINGDRAAIRKLASGWQAFGSPYAGTSGIYRNTSAPLRAIVVLQQAKENHLRQLTPGEAFRCLYPEITIHHWDKTFVANATDLCIAMIAETPVYLLQCLPEESAAMLLKKGLML